ncbi:MAG: GNAT family N-acetyltransferase [Gammaproteobacteria bacterium]|nr:GNAT family N-acetyltransferase [Gammaproteobacteria bacterium]
MNIKLRQARLDEADLLTALAMRSKRSNGYNEDFMARCRDELTVTRQSLAAAELWVAETDIVCGCVGLSVDETGNSGEVFSFFVDPDLKRQGIGRLLWQNLVERMEKKTIRYLRLDADPSAVAFYQALGFTIAHQVPSGSIEGRTLPHMRIELK